MKQLHSFFTTILLLCTICVAAQDVKIYVSDAENFAAGSGTIYQYDLDGSNPQVFIDEELSWPQDIVFLANENEVLISNLNSNKITRYNAVTGAYINDFAQVPGGPTRMKIGSDNLLYVLQWSATDNKVLRYNLDGTFVDEFTSDGVPRSIGMDWDSNGNFYVSSFSQANVTQFNGSGTLVGEYVNNIELSGPTNIFFDINNDLFVLDWNAGDVERYDDMGGYIGKFITGLGQPEGVDFLSNGNILLGNGTTAEVKQYQADGTFVENTVMSGAGGLQQPNAVILFDRATLGNDNFEAVHQVLLTPSVGTQFTINATVVENQQQVKVYTSTGILVASLPPDNSSWDASYLAEGLYIVLFTNGLHTTSQKIVVKK